MDAPKVKKILELPEWLKELKLQETGIGIYCRVSTTEQRQLRSLSNQITSLIKTVQGWDCLPYLKDVYVDIYTGTSENKRPEFNRMLDDVKAGRIKIVVVKSIQRFGRNTVTVMSAINDIRHAGHVPGGELLQIQEHQVRDSGEPKESGFTFIQQVLLRVLEL